MRFLISLAASAALTLTASAAPLASFTNDNVQAFLKKSGATDIETESSAGVQFVHFSYKGLKYSSSIRFCDEGTTKNCSGLLLAVGFESEAADTLETLNAFNYGFPIATAVKPDPKTLMFGRLVTSLGTVGEGNVAANLGLLIAGPQVYGEFRKTQVVASSGAGSTVLLAQSSAPAAALKPVKLTPDQVNSMMKLVPAKEKLPQ
jgi:hypothetical protein